MSTKFHQTTARIYEFPRRFTAAGLRRLDDKAAGPLACERASIDPGSGWYHEAAIREADRSRKP